MEPIETEIVDLLGPQLPMVSVAPIVSAPPVPPVVPSVVPPPPVVVEPLPISTPIPIPIPVLEPVVELEPLPPVPVPIPEPVLLEPTPPTPPTPPVPTPVPPLIAPIVPVPIEIEAIREQNKLLIEKITELSKKLQEPVVPPVPVTPTPPPPVPVPIPVEPVAFVGSDVEFDDVFRTKEKFNELLSRMQQNTISLILTNIPRTVAKMIDTQIQARDLVKDFYTANRDLVPLKPYVESIANDLSSKNPDWQLGKLFDETAKEVRKQLNLPSLSTATPPVTVDVPPVKPAFVPGGAGPGRGGEPTPTLSEMEKDILETIKPI